MVLIIIFHYYGKMTNHFNQNIWEDNSSGSFNGNLCSFNPQNTNYYNGYLILSLTDINDDINCNEVNGDFNYDNSLDVIDLVLLLILYYHQHQLNYVNF